jgi:hypothetical protein
MKIRFTLIFILIFNCQLILAQIPPPTNEQMAIDAIKRAIILQFSKSDLRLAVIKSPNDSKEKLLIKGVLESFGELGIGVVQMEDSLDFPDLFDFDISSFDFQYMKGTGNGFLRQRNIRRHFTCLFDMTRVAGEDRRVTLTRNLLAEASDEVSPGMVPYVQSPDMPELAPIPPASGWSKYVEPAIMTMTAGILVYLFFANR